MVEQGETPDLQEKAEELRDGMASLLNQWQSQYKALDDFYFGSDASDYAHQNIQQGLTDLKQLEQSIKTTQQNLEKLCEDFNLQQPNLTSEPIISKEDLLWAINEALDSLVPGGKLIQKLLGTSPMPQSPEEWADLVIEASFEFLPFGKVAKVCAGPAKKLWFNKLKGLITKIIKKRGGKAGKTVGRKVKKSINPYINKSKKELLKSKNSYENLIREHQEKLKAFKKNPIGNTAPEKLKQMTVDNPSKEVLLERAKGRIWDLEEQIRKQVNELKKINEVLNK